MSTIFTGVKGNDSPDLKIPLFFIDNNDDVEWWIKNENKFFKFKLPDGIRILELIQRPKRSYSLLLTSSCCMDFATKILTTW